ncbi:MAG: AMP-binding protein [Actinomycetes bacterium]|nr:MAG: 2-succinylbenzoate-CoA ligase [Actinomycetota bacterium]
MLEWLQRRPASDPYLCFGDRVWTYGDTLAEVRARLTDNWTVHAPSLAPDSVFTILAGLAGGGITVVDPDRRPGHGARGQAGDARLIVYTSGSGGSPKGVRLTMRNLEAAARGSVAHLGHGPEDRWLLCLPLHHVGGLSILVRTAYAGGSVEMLPGFNPAAAAEAMRGRVTVVSMVPTMLLRTLDHDPGPYEGLKAVVLGGGPIPDGLLERAAAAGVPALPSYGMTETFGQVATLRPGSPPDRRAHPLPGIGLRIEPDGRIAVSGDQVSPGYLGEPDRTDPWFVTNDRGEIDDEGAIRVLGRADAVIVSGGENVNPQVVETVLAAHPGAGESVVVGVPDEEWGMIAVCLYTGDATPDELAAWLRERVPRHHVPKRWLRVDAIPRAALGKPDRAAARRLAGG